METWQGKQGEVYLNAAKAKVTGLRYPVFIGIIALLVLWAGSLEQQASLVGNVAKKRNEAQYQLLTAKRHQNRLLSSRASAARLDSKRFLDITKQKTDTLEAQANRQLKSVEFELFGIKLATPPQWAAPLWLLFVVGLLFFLFTERANFYSLAGRGVRLLRENDPKFTGERLLLYASPFWLTPQPMHDGADPGGAEIVRLLMGWGPHGARVRWRILALSLVVCLLVLARVTWIGTCIALTFPGYSYYFIIPLMGLLLLSGIVVMVRWLIPMELDDHYTEELLLPYGIADPSQRRAFVKTLGLGMAMGVVMSGCIFWGAQQVLVGVKRLTKRFRKPRAILGIKTSLTGFYRNPKSKTVHYFHAGHAFRVPSQTKLARFEHILTLENVSTLCDATFVCSIEAAAIKAYQEKCPETACKLLLDAITQAAGTISINQVARLADLCAGIAVRQQLPAVVIQVAQRLNENHKTLAVGLLDRAKKWTDLEGKWYKRWKSPNPVKWAGIEM